MVAKITFPKRVEAALNYNEKKVQKGAAICLSAHGYLREASEMNFYQKLEGLNRLNVLNDTAATKTVHISLNFSPTEKLPEKRLLHIANTYMSKIGFGEQPFLVYKHEDAGHPHLHIVSTTIRSDGSRINTHNIGRNQSEAARKEIENLFGLVKASGRPKAVTPTLKPIVPEKALYGKHETKESIANVVVAVYSQYRFCSLPEFNVALKQFNVVADRGKEDSRIYKHGGLTYRLLDKSGNKIGVPIKASAISPKPTLVNLEKKFAENNTAKETLKPIVKFKLEASLKQSPSTLSELIQNLEDKNVQTVLRQSSEGRVHGITFVDNACKCVFNGSDLGKEYSAASIHGRLTKAEENTSLQNEKKDGSSGSGVKNDNTAKKHQKEPQVHTQKNGLLDILVSPQEQWAGSPTGLFKKKKKKKRKPPIA